MMSLACCRAGRNLNVTSNSTSVSDTGALVAAGTLDINSDSVNECRIALRKWRSQRHRAKQHFQPGGDITSNLGQRHAWQAAAQPAIGKPRLMPKPAPPSRAAAVTLSGDVVADGAVAVTATSGALGATSNISSGNAITLRAR